MYIAVHGRAARVESNEWWIQRNEFFLLAGKGIGKMKWSFIHSCSIERAKVADLRVFLTMPNEKLLLDQQRNLGLLEPTPIVSLSADAVMEREISHGK